MSARPGSPTQPRTSFRLPTRFARWASAKPLAAVALVALTGLAAAAITVTYTNSSTVTTSVAPAPIQFAAGDDAGPAVLTDYVSAYAISTNKTYISATVKGVPESTMTIGSFFKLQNVDDDAHPVTLSTTQVSNAYVGAYTIGIYTTGGSLVDTLMLTAASPSVTFNLPAGTTYVGRLTLQLASGAGADNVALTNGVALSFT